MLRLQEVAAAQALVNLDFAFHNGELSLDTDLVFPGCCSCRRNLRPPAQFCRRVLGSMGGGALVVT